MTPASAGFLLGSHFNTEDGGYVPLKHWAFTKLRAIIIQKTAVLILTVVRHQIQQFRSSFIGILAYSWFSFRTALPVQNFTMKTTRKPSMIYLIVPLY
jgi:hypothetical protein